MVTEVGRQPWIIYEVMRTQDALTPVPGQVWHLLVFSTLYLLLGLCAFAMWRLQVRHAQKAPGPSDAIVTWAARARGE